MKKVKTVIALLTLALLLVPASASAMSGAMCGFECNVEGYDFCIYTGQPNYACWGMRGGCISGAYNCGGEGM